MHTPIGWRLKFENRRTDVAAQLHIMARLPQNMRDERRRGGFAVGAGDGDKMRIRRQARALPAEQLDVADDLYPCGPRLANGPMGRGMGERNARRKNERGKARPVCGDQIHHRRALRHGALTRGLAIIPGGHFGAAREKRAHRRKPRPAKAKERDSASTKAGGWSHHLTLSVASPMRARTKETIQKRITICGSDQPSCSK